MERKTFRKRLGRFLNVLRKFHSIYALCPEEINFHTHDQIITLHVTMEKSFTGSLFIDYFWSKKEGKILATMHWYRNILSGMWQAISYYINWKHHAIRKRLLYHVIHKVLHLRKRNKLALSLFMADRKI